MAKVEPVPCECRCHREPGMVHVKPCCCRHRNRPGTCPICDRVTKRPSSR